MHALNAIHVEVRTCPGEQHPPIAALGRFPERACVLYTSLSDGELSTALCQAMPWSLRTVPVRAGRSRSYSRVGRRDASFFSS